MPQPNGAVERGIKGKAFYEILDKAIRAHSINPFDWGDTIPMEIMVASQLSVAALLEIRDRRMKNADSRKP
jgi:hypothetical protein